MLIDARKFAGFSIAAAVVGCISAASLAAETAKPDDARAGIERTLQKVDALVKKRGASVREVAEALYEDDLMITGEGEKGVYRDLATFKPRLEFFMKNAPTCSLKIVEPIRHSGNLAVSFVAEHCDAPAAGGEASDNRVIYVFRKGAKGWRVTMEMFGMGAV